MAAAARAAPLGEEEVAATLLELPLLTEMRPLGISVTVDAADAEGSVRLVYDGPPKLRKAVEYQLRTALREADPRVRRVAFAD